MLKTVGISLVMITIVHYLLVYLKHTYVDVSTASTMLYDSKQMYEDIATKLHDTGQSISNVDNATSVIDMSGGSGVSGDDTDTSIPYNDTRDDDNVGPDVGPDTDMAMRNELSTFIDDLSQ